MCNYKKVAFIENFDSKKSYPQYGYQEPVFVKKAVVQKEAKAKKPVNAELKAAKKTSFWKDGNKKPSLLLKAS